MYCSTNTPAKRRYQRRLMVAGAIYLATLALSVYILHHLHPSHTLTIVLAIVPSIAILAIIAILGLYLKDEKDEFQRDLMIQSLLWGTGCTLAVTSVWGFLELFSNVPRLPQFYVFVLFWTFVGFAEGAVRLRYRGGSNE